MPNAVTTIAYDGLCTFEFGIVAEVFGLDRPELEIDWYTYSVAAAEPGPLRAAGGVSVVVDHGLETVESADILILPGWRGVTEQPPTDLLDAIRAAHARGARLVSICSGAFVLAAAGLLENRPAATHWRYADQLRDMYPRVQVQPDVLYVDDGDILTSAGSAAGIDLCLHIVRSDYGAHVAASVARRLVVQPHRDGGQAQYIPDAIRPKRETPTIAAAMDWALTHLHQPLTVTQLAHHARLAERTFLRHFQAEVGTTPHQWLVRQRLHRAQQLLEATDDSIELVARKAGFGSPESLRAHFRRTLRTSPATYRRTFSRA
jgi:AraC family transcriptional regulator, transcriptional activator FtrA